MTDTDSSYRSYLAAICQGDRVTAMEVVHNARSAGLRPAEIYMEVFQPALREIGRLWQENEISVADEHVATAITQSAMAQLFDEAGPEAHGGGPTLLAACADVERHDIGLRMLCDLLELEGWDTHYLGATASADSLAEMVRQQRPQVVALSVTLTPHVARLAVMVGAVREAVPNPPLIIVGGRPLLDRPELVDEVGADLTATDARTALRMLRERFSA